MIKLYPKKKTLGFQVELPEAESVALLGDFNNWDATANVMKKNKKGVWRVELKLPEGDYQFRYFVDEDHWENDADVPTVINEFGSENSLISVHF